MRRVKFLIVFLLFAVACPSQAGPQKLSGKDIPSDPENSNTVTETNSTTNDGPPDFEWAKKYTEFHWTADFEATPNTEGGLLIKTTRAGSRILLTVNAHGKPEHEMKIYDYYNDKVFEAGSDNSVTLLNERKGRFVVLDGKGKIIRNHIIESLPETEYKGNSRHKMKKSYSLIRWTKTDNGAYIAAGSEKHEDYTDQRYTRSYLVFAKFSPERELICLNRINEKLSMKKLRICSINQTLDQGAIIGCRYDGDDWDILIIKTDDCGKPLWEKKIGASNGAHEELIGVDVLQGSGNIRIIGEVNDKIMVMELDRNGQIIHENIFEYSFYDQAKKTQSIKGFDAFYNKYDQSLYFINSRLVSPNYRITLARGDLAGNILWHKEMISEEKNAVDFDLQFTSDGSVFLLFESKNPHAGDNNINLNAYKLPPPPIKEQLVKYITPILAEWEKRGTYEKVSDYQSRVNAQTRQAMIDSLTADYLFAYGETLLNMQKSNATFSYDTESEIFKIHLGKLGDIYVPVPIDDARLFDENFNNLKYTDYAFALADNEALVLKHLSLENPANQKEYDYDINRKIVFNDVQVVSNFKPVDLNIRPTYIPANHVKTETKLVEVGISDVDVDIPEAAAQQPHTYALVIGNEDYTSRQQGLNNEQNVDYAENDAKVFAEYCHKTLGIPSRQIRLLINATRAEIMQGLAWIGNLAALEQGKARLIFYYSGHGLPDEENREAYLIPVDVSGANPQFGIKLNDIYSQLTEHPAERITVFLDACFSGGGRNQALVAAKNVKVKPRDNLITGNLVSFSSSTGEETSGVFREKQHGYFTYFLLKKIRETRGNTDYYSLYDYVTNSVARETALSGKLQTPGVNVSHEVTTVWKNWKLQ